MHYLIIDTCVWIELARSLTKVREKISDLVEQKKVRLILPQIIIDEWNENKESKVIAPLNNSIRGKIKNARDISQYLDQQDSNEFNAILEKFQEQQPIIEAVISAEIETIEQLFDHHSTIRLPITKEVKLQAVDLAMKKKAPFQNRNSMADALIILSAIDYISQENLGNCVFISSNTQDFALASDRTQLHPDLQLLFDTNGIQYFANVGQAINEIEEGLVSQEDIQRVEENLRLETMIEAISRLGATVDVTPLQEAMRKLGAAAAIDATEAISRLGATIDVTPLQEAMSKLGAAAVIDATEAISRLGATVDVTPLQEAINKLTATATIDATEAINKLTATATIDATEAINRLAATINAMEAINKLGATATNTINDLGQNSQESEDAGDE